MQELEILLNSLIQRGWKPWGEKSKKIIIRSSRIFVYNSEWYINPEGKHIRELVSLESQLWNFVCKNSLIKQCKGTICKNPKVFWNLWSIQWEWWYWCDIVEYRLLESALIPEKELGKFLVENIKVEWNQISTPETK